MAGYWKAPRALARLLAERRLTANAYLLLNFVAQSGADRPEGIATSIGFLADSLRWHERTVRRTLRALRADGLIAFEDHPGVAIFTVRTTLALDALASEPRTQPRTEPRTPGAEVAPEVTSDTASDTPAPPSDRQPAPAAGNQAVATSDTSRTRARGRGETETETKNPPKPPRERGGEAEKDLTGALHSRTNRRRRRGITPKQLEEIADRIDWPEDDE
jgi:DNA-binding MarR family transcriptional regulator